MCIKEVVLSLSEGFLSLYVHYCACVGTWGATLWDHFSQSIFMWFLRFELRPLGLYTQIKRFYLLGHLASPKKLKRNVFMIYYQ